MKIITLTPDLIAMGVQLGDERAARGDPIPHPMLHLPDGTLALIRVENVRWANRRARHKAIAASRTPRPDEICSHCGARLSGGSPAQLIFQPGDALDRMECSLLCHTCAALPDEELLAAHTRRRMTAPASPAEQESMPIDHDDLPPPEAHRMQAGCSERLAWLAQTALDTMRAHRELPSTYFQWCGEDGNRIQMFRIPFCSDEERAARNEILRLICLANNPVYLGVFTEAWGAPNNGPLRPSQSDQRKEVIIIEIVARVADQGVIALCRMHDILRAADGSISFGPGDTGPGHIGDYVVDAMGALLLSSRAERRAATKELRRATKLGKLIKGPRPPWAEQ